MGAVLLVPGHFQGRIFRRVFFKTCVIGTNLTRFFFYYYKEFHHGILWGRERSAPKSSYCQWECSSATTRPVYKLEGKDRYIYWNPSPSGWRIGAVSNLAGHGHGNFWFKSGKDTPNPADSKVSWTFHDDPTITVKVDRPPTATENSMFQMGFGFLAARAASAAPQPS